MYVVIENTPGYLPEEDDPACFEDYANAVSYMNELAAEYAEDSRFRVEYGYASEDNYAALMIYDDSKMYDLGRSIAVVWDESEEDESSRPADDDRAGGRNTLTRRASGDLAS